jgi:hypothetical protein
MHAMLLLDTISYEVIHHPGGMAVTVEHITLLSLLTTWIHHKHENITVIIS